MNTQDEQNPEAVNEAPELLGSATYSPEDNKLRLYVGRVERDVFNRLRAEGWKTLHKQREAGGGDFAAVWTVSRRNTAIELCGIIEDEDMGPDERAADRAERFSGYRDKRTGEAVGHADRYDAGPSAHGFQNEKRAERAAARHDRIAGRAYDSWEKAEYWQRRTAGVISHALHMSSPSVRMGRIKTIEADLRRNEKYLEHRNDENTQAWVNHFRLRIAYENQMLEAQGGRAALVQMEVGGWIGSHQIRKINKSPATGLVVSVQVAVPSNGFDRWGNENPKAPKFFLENVNIERVGKSAYTAPTEEDKAAMMATKKAEKAAAPKKAPCPLINPTDEEAERLQQILNERAKADHCSRHLRSYGKDYAETFKPSTVCRITQANYSAVSQGAYARAETRGLHKEAELANRASNMWSQREQERKARLGAPICQVRTTSSNGSDYGAERIIILTDKPQKPFPAAVWEKPFALEVETATH